MYRIDRAAESDNIGRADAVAESDPIPAECAPFAENEIAPRRCAAARIAGSLMDQLAPRGALSKSESLVIRQEDPAGLLTA